MKMTRKDFLKTVALGGLTTTLCAADQIAVLAQEGAAGGKSVDFVALLGGEPEEMFTKGIDAIGGMTRFVSRGDKVVIKPNIGWDTSPELAGNTNPDLVVSLINACKDCGAKEIVVFDHTCDEWRRCYRSSGIEEAAKKAGAVVMPGNDEKYYRPYKLPNAVVLKDVLIHQAILDCDKWFNVPILKNHGGARMTIAMKNLLGIVWDRRAVHQAGLDQGIADLCTIDKPACLNIVDAYRIMKTNGPRGRNEDDVELVKALFMSTDPVAVDTASTQFFSQFTDMKLEDVKYLPMGEEMNIGSMSLDGLNPQRIRI
ncbi:MAG: DUF362 domain-containing protein [Thermoguttaceae bacterium]|jgi:uncharacterized protein (DUF362 family)